MSSPSSPEAPTGPVAPAVLIAWLRGGLPRAAVPAIVDVRDDDAFAAGHLPGSGHLPAASLRARRAELPPRDCAVTVVAESAGRAREAARGLEAMGYARVTWLDVPVAELGDAAGDRAPAARLWRPAGFLAEVLPAIPRGRAADLAAGSGRDAVYLALHGFAVEAWDESPEALAAAEALAGRAGVAIETRRADLESPQFALADSAYALVTSFRFLHRPLFSVMAGALAPGGHVVIETYRVGQERFGRPRRSRFLLQAGELRATFEALGLEVLRAEERDPEKGPITSRLWARRLPAGDPALVAGAAAHVQGNDSHSIPN